MRLSVIPLALILAFSAVIVAQTKAPVSTKYFAASEALAADDYAKAKAALTDLANESQGDLKARAQAAAAAANIAAMRREFRTLSDLVVKMEIPKGYGVVFCPMYEKGSRWVQKQGTVANPYFGKTMLTCGEFQK
jgi:hypothetical protein